MKRPNWEQIAAQTYDQHRETIDKVIMDCTEDWLESYMERDDMDNWWFMGERLPVLLDQFVDWAPKD